MAKQIAKTYGDALFELALEEDKLDVIAEDVAALTEAFEANKELARLMNHPKVSREEKQQVMRSILDGRVSDEVAGFVQIIIEKGRYAAISSAFEYFTGRVKEYKNIGIAHVTSAIELKQEQKDKIEKRLLETTTYASIEMHYAVDAALIGGLVIRIKDRVMDSSIQTKLEELTRELTKIQLAV